MENKDYQNMRLFALANIASQDKEAAGKTGKTRKASYKALVDETLYIAAFGSLKEKSNASKMFRKGGDFKGYDSMLADCNNLVTIVLESAPNKTYEYTLKSGVKVIVSMEKIKAFGASQAADKSLDFSPRNAWKNYTEANKGTIEAQETEVSRENQALALGAEAQGIDAETLKIATEAEKQDLINQGLVILDILEKENLEKQAPFNEAEIRRIYGMLSDTAKLAFYNEVKNELNGLVRDNAHANIENHEERKTA